jgi:2'-5' RNA ligase
LYDLENTRTFISLNLDENIKNKLGMVQKDLKEELAEHRVKWESSNKFHLTLRFLGDLNNAETKDLTKELEKIKPGFDTIVYFTDSIGFFPNPKYPNVVFIDLKEKDGNTLNLLEDIDKVILGFGIKPDKKFVPHVTFGRFRRDKRQILKTGINIQVPKIEVVFESFHLMKSILNHSGSDYETIKKYNFKS